MDDKQCRNHTCLVLTGEQGKFKPTFLDLLCPPALSDYRYTGKILPLAIPIAPCYCAPFVIPRSLFFPILLTTLLRRKARGKVLAVCWTSPSTERVMPKLLLGKDCAMKPTRKRKVTKNVGNKFFTSKKRKLRKNAHFPSRMRTFASDKSKRSLAIQNSVPQSTPLIFKSLPIHSPQSGNALLSSEIVSKRKKE